MPGKDNGVIRQRGEAVQALVHRRWVTSRQIGAAATLQEESVAGDQATERQEALASRCVPRRVDQHDFDAPDRDDVTRFMCDQIRLCETCGPCHPGDLVLVDMNGHRTSLEERGNSFDGVPHHRTTDVVGVIVGGKHSGDAQALCLDNGDEIAHVVRGIHEDTLTGVAISDRIGQVDHLCRHGVTSRVVLTGEQLAEEESVVRRSRHVGQNRRVTDPTHLRAGDRVLVGRTLVTVDEAFASGLHAGDVVLGIAASGSLRRIPAAVAQLVDEAMSSAVAAFREIAGLNQDRVTAFYETAASLLEDDRVFEPIRLANSADVADARDRGRSTTRLELTPSMRSDMIAALRMWRDLPPSADESSRVLHAGWSVEQHRAPLGVIGFVFEGRPNVFADATGVLRGGNTVVFRIGSDALGTARAIMDHVVSPAISSAGLPVGSVVLLDAPDHAAGWALFADNRLSLAVARGSGPAVAELGSIAQQSGVPVSLHGTGGAWVIVGESAETGRLSAIVEHSLDRKVCNTLNVVCLPRRSAKVLLPVVMDAADRAAARRGVRARVHAVGDALALCGPADAIEVRRAGSTSTEPRVTGSSIDSLSHEFEWEENPEFHVVLVDSVAEACDLFNAHSPQFVVSCVSEDDNDHDKVWAMCNAPFVGDGFTRWVDGQFALLRPELGLSNWQFGRLFARSGILSGDSAYSVRLKMSQQDADVHR